MAAAANNSDYTSSCERHGESIGLHICEHDDIWKRRRRRAKPVFAPRWTIEVYIVFAIIAVLLFVVVGAIDASTRLAQARDAVRAQDIRDLIEATQEYIIDHAGITTGVGTDQDATSFQMIGTGDVNCNTCQAVPTTDECANLEENFVDEYFKRMPIDPDSGTRLYSGYYINVTPSGRVQVGSCFPELKAPIRLQR